MFNINDKDEKINQERISKLKDIIGWLLDSYYKATGFKAFFMEKDGKVFLSSTPDIFFCDFCRLIQSCSPLP